MRLTQSRTACERWHRSRPVSSASWTALVCAFRGLHKTGVPLRPHLFLMGPGPCVGQRLAGVRGQSAPQNRGISDWRPSLWSWEPGLFHHHVPLRVGVGSSPRGSFPAVNLFFLYSPELHMKPLYISCSPKTMGPHPCSPRTLERAFYAHCTDGPPRPARLVFLFLCFWPWSRKAGSPGHLALGVTGVSLGQVGSISLGDPSLREGHPCCYFRLLQVGLLPPQGPQLPRLGGLLDLT